jgi:hypothetical protein
MDHWLRCTVSHGMFSTEYAIQGQTYDGKDFVVFAERDDVELDKPLADDRTATTTGWLRVEVGDKKGDLVLVMLPTYVFGGSRFVTVTADMLQRRKGTRRKQAEPA